MSVAQAQAEIDSAEFAEWAAYDRVEPFGERRADLRNAITSAVVANAFRGKDSKTFQAADFLPDFDKQVKKQTPEEMFNILRIQAEIHNANLAKKAAKP